MGFESIFVEEELVAEIDESGFEIAAPQILGGRAIVDEFADVLRKAAAEIEQLFAVLDPFDYLRVRR